MRKVLSLLLCVALLCSLAVVTVHADGTTEVQVADVVALKGTTISVDVNIANNPGFSTLQLRLGDEDELGVTYEMVDNTEDTLSLTANDAGGVYFWVSPYNATSATVGTLNITIPEDAEAGEYTFTVAPGTGAAQAVTTTNQPVEIGVGTFTVTVVDKMITGVNVAIDAGIAIGIHVATTDADNTSITAVYIDDDGDQKDDSAFTTVEDYKEDEENGGYIYYLKVNPWDMDKEFTFDLTDNFTITEGAKPEEDTLDLTAIPATARTISILSYCNAVKGTSEELDQLIADLLAFGQQAQIFNGAETASYALPAGLAATEAAWEDGDGNPTDFGGFCSANFPEDLTGKNATAKKKFEFDQAEINFGSQFVVTFTFKNGATATNASLARVKVNGDTYSLDGWNFTYTFNPAEYGGVQFDLYAAASTSATNFAWINVYGPAHYAAYLNDNYGEDAADILAILEAFYLYGASVEAYAATLG